jgi:hypothetical protein
MTFQFYSDPGHGWLRVDLASAKAVGLEPSSFSTFSYQQGHWLYLEEDCDASLFVKAYMDKHNRAPIIKEHSTNRESVIRNYPRIAA